MAQGHLPHLPIVVLPLLLHHAEPLVHPQRLERPAQTEALFLFKISNLFSKYSNCTCHQKLARHLHADQACLGLDMASSLIVLQQHTSYLRARSSTLQADIAEF